MTDPLRVRRVAIAQGASAVLTTFHHLNRTYRSVSVSSPAHGHNTSIVDHLVVVPFCLEEAPTSLKTVVDVGNRSVWQWYWREWFVLVIGDQPITRAERGKPSARKKGTNCFPAESVYFGSFVSHPQFEALVGDGSLKDNNHSS
jgi:hypothetical protein